MFGLPKSILRKLQMLYFLDEQESYTQSRLIAEQINVQNQTVLKYCRELNEKCVQLFPEKELWIDTTTRYGIRLQRENTNFDRLISDLLIETLTYALFSQLIYQRQFSVTEFCERHQVSLSKVRRMVSRINDDIHKYDLHISVSHNVKIVGQEKNIRGFFLLFLVYVGFSQQLIFSLDHAVTYRQIANQLAMRLKIEPNEYALNLLASWYCINELAINNNYHLEVEGTRNAPSELKNWSAADWKFFVDMLTNFELIEISSSEQIVSADGLRWIQLFEAHFRLLTPAEKDEIHQQFYRTSWVKQLQFYHAEVYDIFQPWSVAIDWKHSFLGQQFTKFWQEYDQGSEGDELLKTRSLLNCYNFMNTEQLLPTVKLFMYSQYPKRNQLVMRSKVQRCFSGKYNIQFCREAIEADLILLTETINQQNIQGNQPIITINRSLSYGDLSSIEQAINQLLA
ncbi:helix-turn-helix domain-containing protein [Candidatus Enterococcus willemsii]|uniref:Mga helix-turn-helix domain-containing protein n=1 Tax=Candidatus Enterococcus willemsii TaxID=1857215 RepID=A0ABQ6Z0L8_9ENTE|nr:helix-turn-helix domain-containing protein [Enterococcus sp. CU12B]KAF1304547.1 hypothetical protein BAU17_10110 [Enterococcus sp. CU12B]